MLKKYKTIIIILILLISSIVAISYNIYYANSLRKENSIKKKSVVATANNDYSNNKEKKQNNNSKAKSTNDSSINLQSDIKDPATEIPVLMYHHLLKKAENKFIGNDAIINVEDFESEMKYLHDNGFKTATLYDLEKFIKGELKLPKKTVVITFDDGYLSNYIYAYPILKKYGFNATVFIITDRLKNTKKFDPSSLQYFTYKDMELSKDVFSFQDHTNNLHDNVAPGKTLLTTSSDSVVIKDLEYSKNLLKASYFAYPNGIYTNHLIEVLKNLGFRMAFTMERGYVKINDDPFTLKRQFVGPSTTLEKFKKIVNCEN